MNFYATKNTLWKHYPHSGRVMLLLRANPKRWVPSGLSEDQLIATMRVKAIGRDEVDAIEAAWKGKQPEPFVCGDARARLAEVEAWLESDQGREIVAKQAAWKERSRLARAKARARRVAGIPAGQKGKRSEAA